MPSSTHAHASAGSTAAQGHKYATGPRQHAPGSNSGRSGGRKRAPLAATAAPTTEPPIVIDGPSARVVCVADVRGNMSLFNQIAADTGADAIIHTGDFGFYDRASLPRISDRTLRHLVQYSTLVDPSLRVQLLGRDPAALREEVAQHQDPLLSQFPDLLSGQIKLNVPVFTVWGACEDVAVIERFRTGEYQVKNLTVLDEATSKAVEVGGIRLRLFGLGGAVVPHKLFDNGEGAATIAGGQGTMWTTALQIGQMVDTAQKTFDASETRLLVTHASPGREGLLAQLALALKADLTVSAGLHFRYGASYNEFSVQHDADNFRNKLQHAKQAFGEIWDTVKTQVEAVIDDHQRILLNNALAVANRVPPAATPAGAISEEPAWKNTWNWNLPDAAYGNLVLSINNGRVGAETKSQGFNFAYRRNNLPVAAPVKPVPTAAPVRAPALAAVAPVAPPATAVAPPAAPAPLAERIAPAPGPNKSVASPTSVTTTTTPKPVKERKSTVREKAADTTTTSDLENTSGTDGGAATTASNGVTSQRRSARNPYTLYISQLKDALPVSEDEIRNYFGPAASGIAGVKLVFDKPHRRTASGGKAEAVVDTVRRQRPFAYVEFKDAAAMNAGLERQGEVIKNDIKPVLEHADSNKTVLESTAAASTTTAGGAGEKRTTTPAKKQRGTASESDAAATSGETSTKRNNKKREGTPSNRSTAKPSTGSKKSATATTTPKSGVKSEDAPPLPAAGW